MTQETKWPAPSYDIDDLVRVKSCEWQDVLHGMALGHVYRVTSADRHGVTVMTTSGAFVYLRNENVERWGE